MARETCCALHNRLIDRKTHTEHSKRRKSAGIGSYYSVWIPWENIEDCDLEITFPPGFNSVKLVVLFGYRHLRWTNEGSFYWNTNLVKWLRKKNRQVLGAAKKNAFYRYIYYRAWWNFFWKQSVAWSISEVFQSIPVDVLLVIESSSLTDFTHEYY